MTPSDDCYEACVVLLIELSCSDKGTSWVKLKILPLMGTYLQDPQLSYDNREVKSTRHDFIPRPLDYKGWAQSSQENLNMMIRSLRVQLWEMNYNAAFDNLILSHLI